MLPFLCWGCHPECTAPASHPSFIRYNPESARERILRETQFFFLWKKMLKMKVSCYLAGANTSVFRFELNRHFVILQGGYNLISISESMARCTHSLLGDPCLSFEPGQPKLEAYGSILLTLKYHTKYWKSAGYQCELRVNSNRLFLLSCHL